MTGMRQRWQEQIGQTKTVLYEKIQEALASVLPITLIVLVLCCTIAPLPPDTLLALHAARRDELLALVRAADSIAAVQAVEVSYAI